MPGRDPVFHQMQHNVVEQRRDKLVPFIGADAHSARLIPEQRSVEQEQLSDRSRIAAKHSGEQSPRRRITHGGDRFLVFAPRSVVDLIHLILPSPSLSSLPPRLYVAHTCLLHLVSKDPGSYRGLDSSNSTRIAAGTFYP